MQPKYNDWSWPMRVRTFLPVLLPALMLAVSFVALSGDAQAATKKWFPGHYLMVKHANNPDIRNNARSLVRYNRNFTGYKVMFQWKDLEPAKDKYDFSPIIKALNVAKSDGKKLAVFLSDRNFGTKPSNPGLPSYLLTSTYEGGWYYGKGLSIGNYWLPAYQARWNKLIEAFGKALDKHPDLAAVMVAETSGPSNPPKSYTEARKVEHLKAMNTTAAKYLPTTPFFQYVNWGVTEAQRAPLMKHIVENAKGGFGSPDAYNCKKNPPEPAGQNGFGTFFKQYKGIAPMALESQPWAYTCLNAKEMFRYAVDEVGVNFMFWAPVMSTNHQTKWTVRDAISVVDANKGRINTQRPRNTL
jgi:hypothetical protein